MRQTERKTYFFTEAELKDKLGIEGQRLYAYYSNITKELTLDMEV